LLLSTPQIREEALRLLAEWRGLLLKNQVSISRQLMRKLLGPSRFTFYAQNGNGRHPHYEIGITPTLEKFFEAVPSFKTVASPTGSLDMYCEVPLVGNVQLAA
jgi:hypothetical protein